VNDVLRQRSVFYVSVVSVGVITVGLP